MRAPAAADRVHRAEGRSRRAGRARLGIVTTLALCASVLVGAGAPSAQAAQATGHDVPVWSTGWSWTYATTFDYDDDAGINVNLIENVTYTNAGPVTFQGQDAYRLDLTGTITGGGGNAAVDGVGNVGLSNFSGSVSGTRFVRQSDLALLQENQNQDLRGTGRLGIISTGITADIDLSLTPTPGWRTRDFPLNPGDNWQNNQSIEYSGGFAYDSSLASGASPIEGSFPFVGPSNVAAATINVPIGNNLPTDRVTAVAADGQTKDTIWWSSQHKNDARELLELPLDGATLVIDRRLSAASTPAPATTVSQTITPSLTCAGGQVTVAGQLSSGQSGVPVSVVLDKSILTPGQKVTASTTTGAGGSYSATLTAPVESDGLAKNGSRGNWGVQLAAGAARNVATLVVTPQNCTTLTYTGDTSAPQGGSATVSATLDDLASTGNVSGRTVTFALSGGATANATTNAAGVASATLPVAGPPRNATLTATYAGNAAQAAGSDTTGFTVGKVGTSTTAVADPNPVTIGDPVTFTAEVDPAIGSADAQGSVQFVVDGNDFGAPVPLSGGAATSPALATGGAVGLGNHAVVARYLGNGDFAASDSPAASFLVRNPLLATTTVETITPTTSVFGQDVTLAATVSANSGGGTPTGEVTFVENGTPVATAPLDAGGSAAVVVDDLTVGSHGIVATYGGDDVHNTSTSAPRTASVAKASVTVDLTSSTSPTVSGEAVSFTAAVGVVAPGGGSPDGSVQLVIDGSEVGTPVALVGGSVTFPAVADLDAGVHTVAATYAGSARYQGGTDTVGQLVMPADTTTTVVATPSPSNEGQNVAITANVAALAPGSGAPTGLVTFTANGNTIGVATLQAGPNGAQGSVNVDDLAPGSYSIAASYVGDSNYRASLSAPISQTVIEGAAIVATSTELTSSKNPSTFGELISFTAAVSADDASTPAGAVQYSVDGTNIGTPVPVGNDGTAQSPTLGSPEPGDHTVIATFVADAGFSGSGDILTQTVAGAGVDVATTSSSPNSEYGEAVTFSATVGSQQTGTGTPSGFVQFQVDGQPLGNAVALQNGAASSAPVSDLDPGQHVVSAVYSGDARFVAGLDTVTQTVATIGTATTLTVSPTSATFGQDIAVSAKVTPADGALGVPDGTVSFVEGSTVLATVPVTPGSGANGTASAVLSDLGAGQHPIRAVYSGSSSFEASTSTAKTVSVAKRVASLVAAPALVRLFPLGLPLGQLRATLTSPEGPVDGAPIEFRVLGKVVCTSPTGADGVATCNAFGQVLGLILGGGYRASFAGDATTTAASATGLIIR